MKLTQLQPGIYVDEDKALHIDAAELCLDAGVPPTKANQDALERAARDLLAEVQVEEHADSSWRS